MMDDVPIKDNPVPPYILNPDASGANFAPLEQGFIGRMKAGDLLQHVDHTHKNTPYEEFIDQGQLNIARSPVVRIVEDNKKADARPSVGLLIGSQLDEKKPNQVAILKVPTMGDGHDFEKASSNQLLYALMIKAVKDLNLPQPERIYPIQIEGNKAENHYLKFKSIPHALEFRKAASDGRLGNYMKEELKDFHQANRELQDAIKVEDLEGLVKASMRTENFQDQETDEVRYRIFRPYTNQQEAKQQVKADWSPKNAAPEETLALKICQINHIDGVEIQHAQASRTDAKGEETEIEYGVAYHFNALEDVQRFAMAVREPLTVKAAMEAVRDDLTIGVRNMPDNVVAPDGLKRLGEKLASAGKGGHTVH